MVGTQGNIYKHICPRGHLFSIFEPSFFSEMSPPLLYVDSCIQWDDFSPDMITLSMLSMAYDDILLYVAQQDYMYMICKVATVVTETFINRFGTII